MEMVSILIHGNQRARRRSVLLSPPNQSHIRNLFSLTVVKKWYKDMSQLYLKFMLKNPTLDFIAIIKNVSLNFTGTACKV